MALEWSTLFDFLGAGGGLMVILNWVTGLPAARRKAKLEKDDVNRHMADKDNERIVELYDQIRDFQERMARLEGCIAKLVVCPVYDKCPARILVQDYKRKHFYRQTGQHPVEQKGVRLARDHPGGSSGTPDTDGQPP